jgi:hypothetical protein
MLVGSIALIAAILLAGHPASAEADGVPGSRRGHDALALCDAAMDQSDQGARLAMLDQGLALAETALRDDDGDAAAHFAVFCTLGRRLQLRPLDWRSLSAIGRLRREIDRALELAPASPGMLTGKGTMLLKLPRILGGNASEGERLLRRALDVSPGFAPAERALVEAGIGR